MKKLAILAARRAGYALLKKFYYFDRRRVKFKNKHEIVTPADLAAEKIILSLIKKYYPQHEIFSEESGRNQKKSDYLWIIDPLDGTTNFSMHHPLFATSIGLFYKSEPILAVIYAPVLKELFVAEKDKGAFLNNRQLRVSLKDSLNGSLLTYCHGSHLTDIKRAIKIYQKIKINNFDIRQLGSASLELGFVASGRTEAIIIPGANSYDVAAGVLLVREAGGRVTDYQDKKWNLKSKDILASNGKVHNKILEVLRTA